MWAAGPGFIPTQSSTALICKNDDWVRSSDLSTCHSNSLTEHWWVIYFLITSHSAPGTLIFIIFSLTALSVSPLLSLFTFFFFTLLPSFSAPCPFLPSYGTWFSVSDWVCQNDISGLVTEAHHASEGHCDRRGATVHAKPKGRGPEFGSMPSYQFCLPPPITTYLPLNTSVCSTQTYLPQKTIIQPKKQSPRAKLFYHYHSKKKKKKPPGPFN